MRQSIILFLTAILAAGLISSCSTPSPEAKSYIEKNTTNQAAGTNEVIDVTKNGTTVVPSSESEKAEAKAENQLRKTVSPGNYPQCIEQFAAAKKIWEKMADSKKQSGETAFLFSIGDRVSVNGKPLEEMGSKPSPVPMFKTWDTSKLTGIDQIESLVTTGSTVEILSKRSSESGNWYFVTLVDSGIDTIKGWLPEKLVAKLNSVPADNRVPPEGQNFNPRGGGRGRGGGGPGGG